jgi:hypothetical protein
VIPGALRAILLGALVLLVPFAHAPDGSGVADIVNLRDDGAETWVRRTAEDAPLLLVRHSPEPPTPAQLSALDAAAAAGATLLAALPPSGPAVTAGPLPPLRAERTAALPFRVQGEPGGTVVVVLADAAGPVDSVRVALDPVGVAGGGLRIRPTLAGWHEWTVSMGNTEVRVGGWAGPATPLRVRVMAGPPAWETRFIVRALEEAGAVVSLEQPLGAGVTLGGDAARAPAPPTTAEHDVVIVMPDAALSPPDWPAIRGFAAAGGGVIAVGDSAAARTLGLSIGSPAAVSGAPDSTLFDWSLPAELAALPAVDFASEVVTFAEPTPGVVVGARHHDRPALLLANAGRGRIATVGPAATWRWRMQAGRIAEHRAFWRSLAEWAAAGHDSIIADVGRSIVDVGERVSIYVHSFGTSLPAGAVLHRPGGEEEPLALPAIDFVTEDTGIHTLAVGGGVVAAVRAGRTDARTDAWSQLARLALVSGGAAVHADSLDERVAAWRATHDARSDRFPALLFLGLVLVACAEWTIRRLSGLR